MVSNKKHYEQLNQSDTSVAEIAEAPVHTRFSVAPQPPTLVNEPRYIHALMLATWFGRLIDPVDVVHHPVRRN